MKHRINLTLLTLLLIGCGSPKNINDASNGMVTKEVNAEYFKSANSKLKISHVDCTLSDGTKTKCYKIETNSTPTDHKMGPWCPTNIEDDASAGGIWLEGGEVYDVDGEFVKNLAGFYKDSKWKMYDNDGNIMVTKTQEDCENAANPNVGAEYENFCVECLPSYISNVTQSFLIPIKPVKVSEPAMFIGGGGGGPDGGENKPPKGDGPPPGDKPKGDGPKRDSGGIPSTRGIALNGVEFSAPAPTSNILGAYTLAPFDDAGGHINVHQGYHYHSTTGVSYSIAQPDGHAKLIGYAMDGYGICAHLDENGNEEKDLDKCRGHYDDVRGYHYHADYAGKNNFINCLNGAYANQ